LVIWIMIMLFSLTQIEENASGEECASRQSVSKRLRRLYACFLLLSAGLLSACSIGGGESGDSGSDIGVSLTTAGGVTTVESGSTLTIKANVTNTTSNMDVTWALAGPNCPSNCGTITRTSIDFADYKAPANVTVQFTVTVTATSIQNPGKSGSVQLTVTPKNCPANSSLLSGQYAFLLQGFSNNAGSGPGIATVGSITADGCGNITGGAADYYFGPTVADYANTLSGSYTIGIDHRGTLSLTVGSVSKTFAIALGKISAGVASKGAMTETAPSVPPTILSGSMWLQDPTAFALNKITGPYAFVFNGWNASVSYGPREAMGGTVMADGAGHFTSGLMDDKVYGAAPPVTGTAWTGTYDAPSINGRAVLIASPLTGTYGKAVIYVVNAGQLIVMISDTSSTGRVFSGSMLSQTGPFSVNSLNGNVVTYQTANYWPGVSGYETLTTSTLAQFLPDGLGNLPFVSVDQNAGANIYHLPIPAGYTYTVAVNGQATISSGSTVGGRWYLTGQNTGLMLGFDVGVSIGMIVPQSSDIFSVASISGNYFASQAPGGSIQSPYSSGVATSTGNGTLDTTMDVNFGGFTSGQQASGTLTAYSLVNGRITDTNNNVIYMVAPSSFLMLNIATPINATPVIQLFEK
jgi:hypothetical protein